jgi:hypothetical protein
VFEIRLLRSIFGLKMDEVTGKWRKLHNEEIRDLYSSPSVIIEDKRNAYRLLVGKPDGKRPLERPRRRWVDNIRMDLGGVGWGDMGRIGQAQDRNRWRTLVNSVLNPRVP